MPVLDRCQLQCTDVISRARVDCRRRSQARAGLPRCDFVHGDALQAMREGGPLDDATVVFCYSSAWASEGGALTDFSELVGCCCLPGCRVVVTDKWLECAGSCGEEPAMKKIWPQT